MAARGFHLILLLGSLPLEAIHVAAHARGQRLLELDEVAGDDVSAQLLFELGGPDGGGGS